jgi:hypothetical protein
MRTVNKIYPEKEDKTHYEDRSLLIGLLSCRSANDYYELLDTIVGKLFEACN